MNSRSVLSVRVDDVTYDEAIERCRTLIRDGGAHQVATVNPEFVMSAQHDRRVRRILNRSDLNVPDGSGLVWACRLAGVPIRGTVRGVDLVLRLAEAATKDRWRVFLLGAGEGVAAAAGQVLERRNPGLTIAGSFAGRSGPEGDLETVRALRAAWPIDLLLVAYGHPAQEVWIARNALPLGLPLSIGVGGAFNYISGRVPRAPGWITDAGLEWLHRLILQPWRWRRQLVLVDFVRLILAGIAARRRPVRPVADRFSRAFAQPQNPVC